MTSKKTTNEFLKEVEDLATLPIIQQHSLGVTNYDGCTLGATQRSTFRDTVSKIKEQYSEIFEPSPMPTNGYSHFKEYRSRGAA